MWIRLNMLVVAIHAFCIAQTIRHSVAVSSSSSSSPILTDKGSHSITGSFEDSETNTVIHVQLKTRSKVLFSDDKQKARKCEVCPEPPLDVDMDRQEATYAALGYLWATSTSDVPLSKNNVGM